MAEIMRTGRTLSQNGPSAPCTIYRVVPGDDRKADEWIGVAFTTEIAEAICAAVNARGIPLPAEPFVPSVDQIRVWLLAHGWVAGSPGPVGALWHPPGGGHPVVVTHDDGDPFATAGALKRIAERSGLPLSDVTREMLRSDD